MSKRKLRIAYRKYLFSFTFEALNPPPAAHRQRDYKPSQYLCRLP